MTTQKKAQGGDKGKAARAQLKARAAEIIKDVRGFDADARREVYLKLTWLTYGEGDGPQTPSTDPAKCERELREVIGKVEKGEPVFDVGKFKPEALEQARIIYRMLDASGSEALNLPDFITNAVRVALDETAEAERMELWLDVNDSGELETGGYSVRRMAVLFERVRGLGVEVEPKRDLAGLISGVMNHPDTPSEIYNALGEALSGFTAKDSVTNTPEVLRVALKVYADEKGASDE